MDSKSDRSERELDPQDEKSSLDWLAYCYLTDELSPAEREAWELRLSVDQAACEAVSRAVELKSILELHDVWTAPPQAAPRSSAFFHFGWRMVAAAAGIMLLVFSVGEQVTTQKKSTQSASPAAESLDVAFAWSSMQRHEEREAAKPNAGTAVSGADEKKFESAVMAENEAGAPLDSQDPMVVANHEAEMLSDDANREVGVTSTWILAAVTVDSVDGQKLELTDDGAPRPSTPAVPR